MEAGNNKEKVHISVVSPVYRAEKIVDELVRRLITELSAITQSFEIILVEDCGPDNSWDKILENCKKDPRVRGIKLSRNFGQHHAITAGLDYSRGEWVIVMDCDLQDRPEEIINLYNEAQKGYDVVFARRQERQDNMFRRVVSKWFYKFFSYLSGMKQDGTIANFGIYSRKSIDAVCSMRESTRAFSALILWVGFKRTAIDVSHGARYEGTTSYNLSRLINFALAIAISFSQKPLRLAIKFGAIISLLSVIYTVFIIIAYATGYIKAVGYSSVIVSVWFLSGIIISTLGVMGLYLDKVFEGTKNRPIYIVDKEENV